MPETQTAEKPRGKHSARIDNRNEVIIEGIAEVTSYDENTVVAVSEYGDVVIRGEELKIKSFDNAAKKLLVEGEFSSLQYVDRPKPREGFFKRAGR